MSDVSEDEDDGDMEDSFYNYNGKESDYSSDESNASQPSTKKSRVEIEYEREVEKAWNKEKVYNLFERVSN